MKKLGLFIVCGFLSTLTSCGDNAKVIKISASTTPHAVVLRDCVADIVKEKGYTLKIYELNYTLQNDGVVNKDYDANYFQHTPYLEDYARHDELAVACKVHYEPLGIYRGRSTGELKDGKVFSICNDTSNAIRAFNLLKDKGVLNNIPVDETGTKLTINTSSYKDGDIEVRLISEELLANSLPDVDFACLPCNTAYTARVDVEKIVAKEDNPELVNRNANLLAIRKDDYLNNSDYKAKIDVLTDALLSEEVENFFYTTFLGTMTCDETTQIDLRSEIK